MENLPYLLVFIQVHAIFPAIPIPLSRIEIFLNLSWKYPVFVMLLDYTSNYCKLEFESFQSINSF